MHAHNHQQVASQKKYSDHADIQKCSGQFCQDRRISIHTVQDKILQTRAKNTLKRPLKGSLSVFTELSSQLQVLAVSQASPQDQFILPSNFHNLLQTSCAGLILKMVILKMVILKLISTPIFGMSILTPYQKISNNTLYEM